MVDFLVTVLFSSDNFYLGAVYLRYCVNIENPWHSSLKYRPARAVRLHLQVATAFALIISASIFEPHKCYSIMRLLLLVNALFLSTAPDRSS